MRFLIFILGFMACAGAATASDSLYSDARQNDSGYYSVQAFYRLSFGSGSGAHSRPILGLQLVSEKGSALGAPALMRAEFDLSAAATQVTLNDINLNRSLLVARQNDNDEGLLAGLTWGEIASGAAAAAIIVIALASHKSSNNEPTATGAGP